MTSKDCACAGAGPFVSRGGIAYLNYCKALPAVTWPCDGHVIGLSLSNA